MKNIFTIIFLLLFIISMNSQDTIYKSSFDNFTTGTGIAKQAGDPWTTWSNAPGGAEDAKISETQAKSGTKSVYVVNNNDLVFHFKDKTTGRFAIEWQMFVETGKLGYFNLLGNFNGSSSVWNFQAYVKAGKLIVDADGGSSATVDYKHNQWVKMKLIVDVSDDFATLYADSVEVVSYVWSKGTSGAGTTKKLDGINFYGWNDNGAGNSGYFIDDFVFMTSPLPSAPVNFEANLDGKNVYAFWDTIGNSASSFLLLRNNKVITKTQSLEYVDQNIWPGEYIYKVRQQNNGLGYSLSSDSDTVIVSGGVKRDLVLMEEFTGTWCVYCPGAAMGLRDLIDVNKKEAAAIAYHNGDKFVNAAATARENYYSVDAFPTVICDGNADGSSRVDGGNATTSLYTTYLPLFEKRYVLPGFHDVDIKVKHIENNNYQATVTIEETFNAFSPLKLHAVLTESNIAEVWKNQTEVDFVCRAMYPDANGTTVDFLSGGSKTFTFDISLEGFVKDNCEFVVFLQDDVTKEVTQAAKFELKSIVGTKELAGIEMNIYPNPANNYINILSDGNGRIELFDFQGRMLITENVFNSNHTIDISSLINGIYTVKYYNENGISVKKLIKE